MDANKESYSQVTYLQTVDKNDRIFYNTVMTKSCVTPLKFVSVPRLKLTAATLAVKVVTHLKQEFDIKVDGKCFGLTTEWC